MYYSLPIAWRRKNDSRTWRSCTVLQASLDTGWLTSVKLAIDFRVLSAISFTKLVIEPHPTPITNQTAKVSQWLMYECLQISSDHRYILPVKKCSSIYNFNDWTSRASKVKNRPCYTMTGWTNEIFNLSNLFLSRNKLSALLFYVRFLIWYFAETLSHLLQPIFTNVYGQFKSLQG